MASERKLASGNIQVQIRKAGIIVTRTLPNRKLARAFAAKVESDIAFARAVGKAPACVPLFNELCNMYMAQYSGKDPSTAGRLLWWSNRLGDLPVTKIDEFMVDDGLQALYEQGRTGSTINRYKSTLSATCIYFIQHPKYKRLGFTNPVRKESVSRYSENPPKERFLDLDEQQALLCACRNSHWDRLYLLVLMALTTGARKGELLNLKWSDCDLKNRTASLATTKNGKPRLLPITQPVVEEMIKYRGLPDGLVFPSTVSTEKPFDIKKAWVKALTQAGIDNCRFHDLRHTAASNLVRAGRTLFEIGTLLGHSSTTMTARYSHLAIHDTQKMIEAVMGELR